MNLYASLFKSVDTYFLPYSNADDESFALIAADFVDSFLYKDMMEVWVLDKNGNSAIISYALNVARPNETNSFRWSEVSGYARVLEQVDRHV